MEADLQRYYQIDLVDFWRGTLSFRKLSVLVRKLPDEAQTTRKLTGNRRGFTLTDHLLADLWTLKAKSMNAKSAPDDHPWRTSLDDVKPADGKREKLLARQKLRANGSGAPSRRPA